MDEREEGLDRVYNKACTLKPFDCVYLRDTTEADLFFSFVVVLTGLLEFFTF